MNLEEHITLRNQRRLRIRPLRLGEVGAVRELYRRLSPRTRYLRFFSPMPVLPDAVLNLLTRVDNHLRLALLVETDTAEGTEVVALGDYSAVDDSRAEVGLVVQDEWQRQGIGTALAGRVLRAAEARGFNRFVAHVLSENTVVRKLIKRVGEIVSAETHQGVSEIGFVSRRPSSP